MSSSIKHASRRNFERLLEKGVDLYEYVPTMMHAKIMVVDGILSVVGSGNFDNRSLELNDEITLAVFSADLGVELTKSFEADLAHSNQWRLDDWRKRPWHWKAREWFWSIFGELF